MDMDNGSQIMNERILLTGAKGFVGSNVSSYLADNIEGTIVHAGYDIAHQELQDEEGFDFIVNIASRSSVEASVKDPVGTIENNVMLVTRLLDYARQHPPKLFIQFSTVEARNITNPYAASKKAQEDIALAYSRTYGIPVVVIHSTNIIGKGQSPDKFIPKLIEQIRQGEPVVIYTNNGVRGERVYNPVKNVGAAILKIIKEPQQYIDAGYSEVGIPGGERVDNLQIAEMIAKLMNRDYAYTTLEPSNIRPNYLQSYDTKDPIVEFEPVQTLEDGLREAL